MPRKRIEGICKVNGCNKPLRCGGLCNNHYQMQYRYGRLHKVSDLGKRKHPHYLLWFDRKQTNDLAPEWQDFWKFVKDIGDKPGPNFFLIKPNDAPYGPANFKWYEKLKRKPGETIKDWYARKWQSRRKHFPHFDNERRLKKKYGINLSDYERMFAEQHGVCAICKQKETSFDARTSGIRRLSIDHCHRTGKVRALLCFRCNSTIGRIDESHDLMLAMSNYLRKYA